MKVGFTGSQRGMTEAPKQSFDDLVAGGLARILVTGSRSWPSADSLLAHILRLLHWANPGAVLVVGYDPARRLPHGVDEMAYNLWVTLGGKVEPHPADWDRYGRGAGFRRNTEMVDSGADLCLAFVLDHSPGATDCLTKAGRAGIPVRCYPEPVLP